jgi:hypothetical protein
MKAPSARARGASHPPKKRNAEKDPPRGLGEKEEKYVAEKRKIIPNIVDTSFCSNAEGQCTHSAQTNKALSGGRG